MRNPCFDQETGVDCPNRKAGCAVGCEKWEAYVKVRDREYELRKTRIEVGTFEIPYKYMEQRIKNCKYDLRNKR
jgi:hypothetical protein